MNINKKKLVVFDLDGTLTESKSPMDQVMADLLVQLLEKKMVAIISGGAFGQFEKQLMPVLHCSDNLFKKLFFFPTTGTRFYRYTDHWEQVYADEMTLVERTKIKEAFEKKEVTEDEKFQQEKRLQEITDEYVEKIGEIGKAKEQELLQM